jgi:hypothetical protein
MVVSVLPDLHQLNNEALKTLAMQLAADLAVLLKQKSTPSVITPSAANNSRPTTSSLQNAAQTAEQQASASKCERTYHASNTDAAA